MNMTENSLMSLPEDSVYETEQKYARKKASLPKISGVNKRSLALLIDKPELLALSLTPSARRGFQGRNLSINIGALNQSSIFPDQAGGVV